MNRLKGKNVKIPFKGKIRMKKFMDELNNIYKEQEIICKAENIELKRSYIDSIPNFIKNNSIELLHFDDGCKIISGNREFIKYNEEKKLKLQLCSKKEEINIKRIEFIIKDKSITRIFSRGNFKSHGRFYSIWSSTPKALRKNIYLNGSLRPLERFDFKCSHLRIAYHLQLLNCGHDLYHIDGYEREIFKIVCMVAINANDKKESIFAIQNRVYDKLHIRMSEDKVTEYIDVFYKHHDMVKDYLFSDFVIKAMFIESNIIYDILKELTINKKIICLSIHDEILFLPEFKNIVQDQMVSSYRKIIFQELINKKLLNKNDSLPNDILPVLDK